jgi:hypothetical protein
MNKIIVFLFITVFSITTVAAQHQFETYDREKLREGLSEGNMQYGLGLKVRFALARKSFGNFRFSVTGGLGIPYGADLNNTDENHVYVSYFAELDIFRGGLGASSETYNNQKLLFELRQTFLFTAGFYQSIDYYSFMRPQIQFLSSASRPLYDPFPVSVSLGTIFINGLNIQRAQRMGIINLGILPFSGTYINDGPPFHYIGLGDGNDQWWTGNGMIGIYSRHWYIDEIEIKYDKFTGLQPYAYEQATALRMRFIPYANTKNQLENRQKFEVSFNTVRNIGVSLDLYDFTAFDIQHYIHKSKKFSFHNTPLERYWGFSFFYSNTFQKYEE